MPNLVEACDMGVVGGDDVDMAFGLAFAQMLPHQMAGWDWEGDSLFWTRQADPGPETGQPESPRARICPTV